MVGGIQPRGAQRFQRGIGRPAERRASAVRSHAVRVAGVGRIQDRPYLRHAIPSAFVRFCLIDPARHQRPEVHLPEIDVQPEFREQPARDLGQLREGGGIGGRHQQDRLALVAGFRDQFFCQPQIAGAGQNLQPGLIGHRRALGEEAVGDAGEVHLIADDGLDEGALVDGRQQGAQQLGVIEWRIKMVECQYAQMRPVDRLHSHSVRLFQHRDQIGQRPFEPIELPGSQRRRGGGGVGLYHPFHPVDMRDFAAGQGGGRFVPRLVFVEFGPGGAGTGHPLDGFETERTGTDGLLDLDRGRGFRHALRHHEAGARPKPEQHLREGLLQANVKALVVEGLDLVQYRRERLAERVLHHPPCQRRGAVDGPHLFVVVEQQPVAEGEGPGQFVRRQIVTGAHLRTRFEMLVDAVKHIVDQITVRHRRARDGPDRVEIGQIDVWDEANGFRGALRDGWARQCGERGGGSQDGAAVHDGVSPYFAGRVACDRRGVKGGRWDATIRGSDMSPRR